MSSAVLTTSKGASTSVRVALEKPLLTWPGRACKESHQDAAAPPQQLDGRVSSQIGGGLVLEDISVSEAMWLMPGAMLRAWQIAACGRSLSWINIWLRGGTVPENEQGPCNFQAFAASTMTRLLK